jgi:hypothetical protein
MKKVYLLFILIALFMHPVGVLAEENNLDEIIMPKDMASYLDRYGLCSSDFHTRDYTCRKLGPEGYWLFVGIYEGYISGALPLDQNILASVAMMSLYGGIKKCINPVDDCAVVNDLDGLEKVVFGRSTEKINAYDLIARIQLLGTIYTASEFLEAMERNGRKMDISHEQFNILLDGVKIVSCNINDFFCDNEEYLRYVIHLPAIHMLFYYLRGNNDSESVKISLSNRNWLGSLRGLSSGWTDLEAISFKVGHLRNARLANSLSREFYEDIQNSVKYVEEERKK